MPTATLPLRAEAATPVRGVPAPSLPATGFVREARLLVFLPFSHSTLWRRVKDGTFPAPHKISARISAWRVEDVHAWIEGQRTASAD